MKRTFLFLILLTGCLSQHDVIESSTITQIVKKPDIMYTTCHDMSSADTRTAAESLARSLQKYGVEWSWDNNEIIFKVARGPLNSIHGLLMLTPTTVAVEIYDLPDFIPHFIVKPKIETKINTQFHHSNCHQAGGSQ